MLQQSDIKPGRAAFLDLNHIQNGKCCTTYHYDDSSPVKFTKIQAYGRQHSRMKQATGKKLQGNPVKQVG